MDDLEAIRQRKLRELQERQAQAASAEDPGSRDAEEAARAEQEAAIERLLQQILDMEARERLQRIRMSRPEFADLVTRQLITMAQSGKLRQRLGDQELRAILQQLQPKDRDINITRK